MIKIGFKLAESSFLSLFKKDLTINTKIYQLHLCDPSN